MPQIDEKCNSEEGTDLIFYDDQHSSIKPVAADALTGPVQFRRPTHINIYAMFLIHSVHLQQLESAALCQSQFKDVRLDEALSDCCLSF